MQLHHVIRIEHPVSGKGPIRHYTEFDQMLINFSQSLSKEQANAIPLPIDIDCPEFCFASTDFVCGVEYISQLYTDWFFDFVPKFIEAGFEVYLYTLPKKEVAFW